MKKLKFISGIGFILAATYILISMTISTIQRISNGTFWPEDNGIDLKKFSIDELTEEQIVNTVAHFQGGWSSSHQIEGDTGVEGKRYFTRDYDKSEITHKNAVGIQTVSASRIENATLRLTIKTELFSGKMKMALIDDEGTIQWLSVGEDTVLEISAKEPREYYVKIICEDANMSLTLTREIIPNHAD